jgi:Uri superfamily endonuclease
MRGTYVLLLHAPYDFTLNVGELGNLPFKMGYYAYVGSALGGLSQRVRRHLVKKKKIRWHIDYLLSRAPAVDVIYARGRVRKECAIAEKLAKRFEHIRGFGSSDCKCGSHLFYSPNFHMLLRHVILAFKACGLKPAKGVGYG